MAKPAKLPSEILREDGWCKKVAFTDDGRHCLVGAFLESVSPSIDFDGQIMRALRAAIRVVAPETRLLVTEWNDAQPSAAPVIAAAERAERLLGWVAA